MSSCMETDESTDHSGLKNSSPKEDTLSVSQTVVQQQQQQSTNVVVNVSSGCSSISVKEEPIDSMPPLASPATVVNVVSSGNTKGGNGNGVDDKQQQRDLEPSPPATVISLAPAQPYPSDTQLTFAAPPYDLDSSGPYTVQVNTDSLSSQYATVTATPAGRSNGTVYLTTADYITYCDYYPVSTTSAAVTTDQYQAATVRHLTNNGQQQQQQQQNSSSSNSVISVTSPSSVTAYTTGVTSDSSETSFLDRYLRQNTAGSVTTNGVIYKTTSLPGGLTVDLPSPDSGIGEATITPRPDNGTMTGTILPVTGTSVILDQQATITVTSPVSGAGESNSNSSTPSTLGGTGKSSGGRRSWHEYGRNSEVDKVQIPKIFSDVGYKYYLESPISTSQRREDDRITYINKGQFYGITLEYIPDAATPLKSATVKSLVLLVFREEKIHEDEIKAWQFWHSRQHSVKQRILDADTKNSSGIIGPIEEVTHNSIAFYWNPLEGPAKINVAVQCLSTDFSNQKGVKGLPLHLQIDTFDDFREGALPVHRGYCQIKVFCDKGAERKTRDEERRAAKRKLSATGNGRKKIEEMYHPPCDRSEFYTMSDRTKPPVLFTPSEDLDKITTGDMSFYGTTQHSTGDMSVPGYDSPTHLPSITPPTSNAPNSPGMVKRERNDPLQASIEMVLTQPPVKRTKVYPPDRGERRGFSPPSSCPSDFSWLSLIYSE
ncbi:grainy head isoform X2 [Brevipalpus obovatus]|uniref:grainy head isoform X2 n=1 Tax=Brevipalpus obovatus TaxID=246614 RepID=UPI003D9DC91D